MASRDDEEEERRRQEAERQKMSLDDRIYGEPPKRTITGDEDIRSHKRTGRILSLVFRTHPLVKAMVIAIIKRDQIPSLAVALELFVEAYLKTTRPLAEGEVPSLDEIVRRLEQERDKQLRNPDDDK